MYDITAQATQSLTESSQFKTAGLSVENQISMAQYIRDYLLNDTKLRDLIPANVAITNVSISDQIKNYNELMLRRDKLAGNASSNSQRAGRAAAGDHRLAPIAYLDARNPAEQHPPRGEPRPHAHRFGDPPEHRTARQYPPAAYQGGVVPLPVEQTRGE